MIAKYVAYTFEQSKLNCILHSSIDKGQKYTRGKQTGFKKPNFILSLPEISYCSGINRKRRCRSEPKCNHVDCLRNAHEIFGLAVSRNSIFFNDQDSQVSLGSRICILYAMIYGISYTVYRILVYGILYEFRRAKSK